MAIKSTIMKALDMPRCAREIAEAHGLRPKSVQTALRRLEAKGLIRCVTPSARQSRLNAPTPLGIAYRQELDPNAKPWSGADLSNDELGTRSWIQAGRYRRWVLEHLREKMTPRELRIAIIEKHPRISMTHVHAVLRDFRDRGIASSGGDGRWELTAVGERLRV